MQLHTFILLGCIEITQLINYLQHQKDLRTALESATYFGLDQLLLVSRALKQGNILQDVKLLFDFLEGLL